jgi:hypothetical protein
MRNDSTPENHPADDSQPGTQPPNKRRHLKAVEASCIHATAPTKADVVYMARELILCTLPHSDPGDMPAWSRQNGDLTLTVRPGWNERKKEVYGYPYGIIPRLLLVWIVTEIIRTKSRRLELGKTLSEFLAKLGLNAANGTGKRSDARRVREQMERLFHAVISFDYSASHGSHKGHAWLSMQVAPKGILWQSDKDSEQAPILGSWIEIGEDFYKAVMEAPNPLDIRVLHHVKDSSLGIDLYTILNREAFRAMREGKPSFMAWEWLHVQTGNECEHLKLFRRNALVQIKAISAVHSGLVIKIINGRRGQKSGLEISNLSCPSIPPEEAKKPAPRTIDAIARPAQALASSPPSHEGLLKPTTVEKFRARYPRLDPYACKSDFDAWVEGLPPGKKPRYYDAAFLGFAKKWIVGKLIVSPP